MPKIDLDAIPWIHSTGYPPPYDANVRGRSYRLIGRAGGITDLEISQAVMRPGAWSSQRHWHEGEDEFLVMLTGEAVLVDDQGRTLLKPGDCAAFPKADGNGHHLINESDADCSFIVLSIPETTDCHYPDADLHLDGATQRYTRKDGTPY